MSQPLSPSHTPVITTERLILRGHRVEDFQALCEIWTDPVVTRHTLGRASTPEESWARLLRYPGLWALLGFGYWAIEERASGRFVGDLGFGDFHRQIEPPLGDAPEMGWVLSPHFHGLGYATEAGLAALGWIDRTFPGRRTVSVIAPENTASIRVAEKLGYREYGRGLFKDSETVMLERM